IYTQPARVAAAWTSATSSNTRSIVQTGGLSTVTVTVHATSTMTGGVLTFEVDDDQDNTTWYPLTCTPTNADGRQSTYTLTVADAAWRCQVAGWARFAVRLSTTITGSGTANVAITTTAAPLAENNESVNVALTGGVATTMNKGASDAGTQ